MKIERISVGLVACASAKATSPQPARLLYQSPLFRAASAYAAAAYDHWFILSARHYLVEPLEPYDQALQSMTKADRDHWGAMVESGLRLGYGCMTEGRAWWPQFPAPRLQVGQWLMDAPKGVTRRVDVWFHAGADYVAPVLAQLATMALPYDLHTPLAHLGIGQQLAWYADHPPPRLF